MATAPSGAPATVPPRPASPPWADPRLVMFLSSWRATSMVHVGGDTKSALKADPLRVACGFALGVPAGGTWAVGPTSDPSHVGFGLTAQVPWIWFDLFTFGPIVTAEWFTFAAGAATIGVYEIYRLP